MDVGRKFRNEDLQILHSLNEILKKSNTEGEGSKKDQLVDDLNRLCGRYPDSFIVFSLQQILSPGEENQKDVSGGVCKLFFNLLFQEIKRFYNSSVEREEEQSYCCPIYSTLLQNPVLLNKTGQTYEKKALDEWFETKKSCPLTGQNINDISYTPNSHLKSNIDQYKTKFVGRSRFLLEIVFGYFEQIAAQGFLNKDRVVLLEQVFQKVLVFKNDGFEFLEIYVRFLEFRQKNDFEDIQEEIHTKKGDLKSIQRELVNFFLKEENYLKATDILQKMLSQESRRMVKEKILLDLITCYERLKLEEKLNAFILDLTKFYMSNVSQDKAMTFLQSQTDIYPTNNVLLKALAEYHGNPRYVSAVYYQIGTNYYECKEYEKAIQYLNQSVDKDNNNKRSYRTLKKIYSETNSVAKSLECCFRLISLSESFSEKQDEIRNGLQMDPKNTELRKLWCELSLDAGKYENILEITSVEEENELLKLRTECFLKIFTKQQSEIAGLKSEMDKQRKMFVELRAELEGNGLLPRKKSRKKKKKKSHLVVKDSDSKVRLDEKIAIPKRNQTGLTLLRPSLPSPSVDEEEPDEVEIEINMPTRTRRDSRGSVRLREVQRPVSPISNRDIRHMTRHDWSINEVDNDLDLLNFDDDFIDVHDDLGDTF